MTVERKVHNLGDHLVDLKGEQTAASRDKHSAGLSACSMHRSWGALMVDMKACSTVCYLDEQSPAVTAERKTTWLT